ncbi:alpha/beta hydrolase [Massilia violaceinigra]|uniref:Alpha/beta hydrolase n=1 Tax=Massilia violaceinigra TaxID=2045208 RepID=A0A2D2DJ24_9BURK|nr:alpha/beta fold hydrolase [Massilia violaceinigra]ATQ74977.1 alpha/beta hydrolase [Massilia violaceinigra]
MRFPALLLAIGLAGCGTMQIEEKNFIHPDGKDAPALARVDVAALLPAYSVTGETVATPDGATLRGVYLARAGAAITVLYFGGNAFHLDQHARDVLPLLAACGSNVAVFDYRGYGRSSGVPTVENMRADALRVFDHVNAINPGKVAVHGQSLGSFMAAYVASQRPLARGMVLEATATTVQEWTDANVPWYLKLFLKVDVADTLRGVDNQALVRTWDGPSLVLSGEKDQLIPVAMSRKVYDAIPGENKQWHVARGASHNGILAHPDVSPVYCDFVRKL